jgi:hypothetical protein
MSKTFFIVVPFSGIKVGGGMAQKQSSNPFAALLSGAKKPAAQKPQGIDMQSFEEARVQLEQRVNTIEQGLARCDIRTTRLGTEEITELFYRKFNPGELDSAVQ